jgi:lactoylglutathione lyase
MSDLPPLPETPTGRYRHYKGGEYEVIGVARHSETLEPLVVYRPLYNASGLWVRRHAMFFGQVEVAGTSQPRFTRVPATATGTASFAGREAAPVRWTHFTIPVSDMDGTIGFFTHVCGLTVVRDRRNEGGSTVWIGPRAVPGEHSQFVVVLYQGAVREPLDHFGFQCDRREDVTAIADRARERGALVEGPIDAGGSVGYYAIVREPSGHLVEFTFGQPLIGLPSAS